MSAVPVASVTCHWPKPSSGSVTTGLLILAWTPSQGSPCDGGAVVIAKRGNTQLATEIAITSSMQVALFVAPVVALVSLTLDHRLTLAFRPVEIGTMALAAGLAWLVTRDGTSKRWEGFLLAGAYAAAVLVYALS